ncbi:pseudouridine synthase [Proteobacteria bacterium 005FR1]|nr:pseudouridine synthase [Proteobacteria bacterium 005FR1]
MRLDKFISHATGLSRSESRRAIKSAAVQVNGELERSAQRELSDLDRVTLRDELLTLPSPRYLMLNKPAGYVSATTDSENPTVIDLLEGVREVEKAQLSVAGRLDKDTTGLVLLSSDGQWIHRVTSPRHEHFKVYIAGLAEAVSDDDVRAFAEGIQLKGETRPTRPARLDVVAERTAEVSVVEGRYHQVRRMFAARGNHVVSLHRREIGPIILDPALAPGDYRDLTAEEVSSFS